MAHRELNRAPSTASSITLCAAHPLSDLERGSRAPASLSVRYPPTNRPKPRGTNTTRPSRTRLFYHNLRSESGMLFTGTMACTFAQVISAICTVPLGRTILGRDSAAGLAVDRAGIGASMVGILILGPGTGLVGALAWAALDAHFAHTRGPNYRGQHIRHVAYIALWSCLTVCATQGVGALVTSAISARLNAGRSPASLYEDPPFLPILAPVEIRYVFASGAVGMGVFSPVLVLLYAGLFYIPCFRREG